MNWAQLKTILWLRWQLTRNQWARGGNFGAVLAAIVLTVLATMVALLFAGALLAGVFAFRGGGSPLALKLLLVWDAIICVFLVAWMVGLLTELQRSETIDLQRLMHLPVALGQIFAINYIASHVVFSIMLVVPVMLGFSIGLAIGHGIAYLLLLPLSLGVVFMITAWTYCLRGWFAALMSNPRRRRSALVIISMVVVLLSQAPNIYFNVVNRQWSQNRRNPAQARQQAEARKERDRRSFESFVEAHKFIPPLWLSLSARSVTERRYWPPLLATAGCLLIGAAGLRRAYTSTVRFYRGDVGNKARPVNTPRRAEPAARPLSGRRLMVERSIPGVPEPAAAVAFATFRSMLRAPEVKMQWAMAIMMTVVFGFMFFLRRDSGMPPAVKPLAITGLITMTLFMLVQVMANQFGFDRAGFRAVVLSPVPRRNVLLGKNLAQVPIPALLALLVTAIGGAWVQMTPIQAAVALLQFGTMFVLVCLLGNTLSILVPYRIRAGTMKPTKLPAKAQLVMFVSHMFFPAVMAPAFLPSVAQLVWEYFEMPRVPVGLILGTLMFATAAAGYYLSLQPLANLLERREKAILDRLGTEVE